MNNEFQLSYLNDNDRLKAYETITNGCIHLWSKSKLQIDRFKEIMNIFISLAEKDPYFLAHFVSYTITKLNSKDLKVVSIFANALSDADGTSFLETDKDGNVKKSEYKKPNLRIISQAGFQMLEPKLALRVIQLANLKIALSNKYKEATHFPRSLKSALRKYIKYRENNLHIVKGIKKNGLRKIFMNLYRMARMAPSKQVAEILRWQQKKGEKIKFKDALTFEGMKSIEIAKKIRREKINPIVALGALPDRISPVVAVAILEQATGNQAIILHSLFEEQGLLKHDEIIKLFEEKLNTAKDALDRVERMNTNISEGTEKALKKAKSEKRKEEFGEIGKIYVHIDISPSMEPAIEFAKEKGAIIAECVKNPKDNFYWGAFNTNGCMLKKPDTFTQGAFMQILYGLKCNGMTNTMACYEKARELKCDVDIFITDQDHNTGSIESYIKKYGKPRAVVIVHFSHVFSKAENGPLYKAFVNNGVPVAVLKPDKLSESALVVQAIKSAVIGSVAIIDEIMQTKLLRLPKWWESIEV
jgi:hypothetical protein